LLNYLECDIWTMSSAEESKAEGTSEATEGTESSSEPAESSAAANDLIVSAAQGASSQANPAVPKTPAQQQPAPTQDSPATSKPSTIPSSPTPAPKSSEASDDLIVSAAQGASSQANPAISKPSTIPSSPTPAPKSSDGPEGLDQGEELKLLLERLRNFFKLSNWIKQDDQTSPWQQLRRPVLLIAALITLVIFVRIYGGILSTIESVPLAPSLFELAGILWLTWFSITRLIRSEDRQDVISKVRTRWEAFRGTTDNKP
ncbi:MAG: CAAD domain-containing protein, partial [Cyanobacteriota bacterium]|nr:CAAD domain-containing protein [Cyanobacteriota bacterium]